MNSRFKDSSRRLVRTALAAVVLAASAAAICAQSSVPRYSIVELQGVPQRMNESGQVAGWVYVGANAHAAIYSGGTWRDLGVPAGDELSALFGISNTGAVAGFSFVSLAGLDDRWQAISAPAGATSVQVLSALTPDSFAYAVNDSGAIVGCRNRYDDIYPDPHRAFLYANGAVTDLHSLVLPAATDYDYTCARGINAAGVVVGEIQAASSLRRGFVYRNGVVTRLEQGASYLLNAKAISSSNKVVGEGRLAGFSADHALVYDVATGSIASLGLEAAGAYSSAANDVNTRGDVVGTMFLALGEHAYLASGGRVFDLNDLLPAGTGWVLQEAQSINSRGQIVGRGYLTSTPTVTRYFLLNLVLDPRQQTLDLADAAAALRASGALNLGNAIALVVTLRVAVWQLDRGKTGPAINLIEAFINELNAFVRAGKLTASVAQPLIDEARRIITALAG